MDTQQNTWQREKEQTAYKEGKAARQQGRDLDQANPYASQINAGVWQAWRRGWKDQDAESS